MTEMTCDGCGDTVATLTNGYGPCCHNLPDPWTRSADGLYNGTDGEDHYDDPDPAVCRNCGETAAVDVEFREMRVSVGEGDEIAYVSLEDVEIHSASCAYCGTRRVVDWA